MVLVLPTIGEQLGPGIDKLIEGINHVINPDYGFQQAMKARLASDPDLVGKLSDLEANAPGTLKKLGFGPLAPAITGTPESAGSQIKRETRGQQVATGEAKANLDLSQIKAVSDKFANDPTLQADFVARALSGQNVGQREETQAAASEQRSRAEILTAQKPGIEAKANLENKALQEVLDKYPELQQMDPVRMVRDLTAGRSVPNFVPFMNMPGGPEAFGAARLVAEAQWNRDMREAALAAHRDATNAEEKANIQNAGKFLYLTRAGTLKSWRTVLEDPQTAMNIQEKANSGVALNQDEKDVLHSLDAQQQQQDIINQQEGLRQISALHESFNMAQAGVKKAASQAGAEAALSGMNKQFEVMAEQGGPLYHAKYGRAPAVGETEYKGRTWPFPPGPQIYFTNAKGERVEDEIPFAVRPKLDSESYKALTALNSLPPDKRQTEIARMKAGRPDVYAKIKDFIK